MALPTEISSMNSLAAAWEDGVDAVNAVQSGRDAVLPSYASSSNTAVTTTVSETITGITVKCWMKGKIGSSQPILVFVSNSFSNFNLKWHQVYGRFELFSGGSVLRYTPPDIDEVLEVTATHNFVTGELSLKVNGYAKATMTTATVASATATDIRTYASDMALYQTAVWLTPNDVDAFSCDRDYAKGDEDHRVITNSQTLVDMVSGSVRVLTTYEEKIDENQTSIYNSFGYATDGTHKALLKSDGTAPAGWLGGAALTIYSGGAAIDLTDFKIPNLYGRFLDAGVGAFFTPIASRLILDGVVLAETEKTPLNLNLPFQDSSAKNVISALVDGVITTVLLDKNHVDYATDLTTLEALAGIGKNIFTVNGLPDQQWGAALYNLTGVPTLIEYKLGSGTSVSFQTSADSADTSYLLLVTPPGCRGIQFIFNPQNSATFTASPEYYVDSNGDRIYDPAVHTLNENISVDLEPAIPVVTLPANTVTKGVDVARLAMYMYQFPIGIEKLVYGADPGNFIEYTDFLQVLDLGDSQLQAAGENASLSSFVIQKNGAPISPTAEFTPAIREIVIGGGDSGGGLTEAQLNAAVADIKGVDDKDLSQVFDNTPEVNLGTITDDVTAILADTNELQQNQGNWITATGFATPVDVPTAEQNAAAVEAALADDFANIDVDNQGIADAVVAGIGESVAVVSVVRPGAQSVSMSVGESNISVAVGDDQTYGMQVA